MGDYSFNPDLAGEIGLEESIVCKNIAFWIMHNKANRTHFYDGKYWTYNTIKAFQELFPFWTMKQMRTIFESLYKKEVLIKGNFNKKEFDKTGWYTFTDKYAYLANLPIAQKGNGSAEIGNADAQKGKPIPLVNTDSNNISTSTKVEDVVIFNENCFTDYIKGVNKSLNKSFRESVKVKQSFRLRIKSGYTCKDFLTALENAKKDQYHIESDFNHLTPEFFTRVEKLEKYLNYKPKTQNKPTKIIL